MKNHSKALVPLESWSYHSPEIRYVGKNIDIGLMAEALIYYDQIFLNIANPLQLADFLNWFISQNKYSELLSLFKDEVIRLYDYSFMTTAIRDERTNVYSIMNIQDQFQEKDNTFEQRFLYHESIDKCFRKPRQRIDLYKALRGKVIEAKAKDFGASIENARLDYSDSRRNALLVQALVDEVHPLIGKGNPPVVTASIEASPGQNHVTYNIDFAKLSGLLGEDLNFHLGTPLTGIAHCNRLIWSAAQEKCDLYLGSPMSNLVGDKLYESNSRNIKLKENMTQLNQEVEFPNIRKLINEGKLDLSEILRIRKKAKRFRDWLQNESDRDRNAIIAYHNEVAKEADIVSLGRKSLRMFGILGLPVIGAHIGQVHPDTTVVGAGIGAVAGYLVDVASKIGEDWKPVVFGNWVSDRIEKVLTKNQ